MIAALRRRRRAAAVRVQAMRPPTELERATQAVTDLIKEADDRVEALIKRLNERLAKQDNRNGTGSGHE